MTGEFDLTFYCRELAKAHPNISELWLLGSRANDTARVESDWDLLAFATTNTFKDITVDLRFHRDDVDLLVVDASGDRFQKPWGSPKSGSLSSWAWTKTG